MNSHITKTIEALQKLESFSNNAHGLIDAVKEIRPFMETWLNHHRDNHGYGVDIGTDREGTFTRYHAMAILNALDAFDPDKLNVRDHAEPCAECGNTGAALVQVVDGGDWNILRGVRVSCNHCNHTGAITQTRHDAVSAWNAESASDD